MHHTKIAIMVKDWLRIHRIWKDDRVFLNTQVGFSNRNRNPEIWSGHFRNQNKTRDQPNPESGIRIPELDRIRINEEYGSPRRWGPRGRRARWWNVWVWGLRGREEASSWKTVPDSSGTGTGRRFRTVPEPEIREIRKFRNAGNTGNPEIPDLVSSFLEGGWQYFLDT